MKIYKLHNQLLNNTYGVSEYYNFKVNDGKEREISKLPYIDRIVHHAILTYLEPIFTECFISQTYSCIKNRGLHKCLWKMNEYLGGGGVKYALKLDIKKFYPSVNNEILKSLLTRKFKDDKLLNLLDIIIDSTTGLPLGNYTSQWLGNFYLNGLDHYIKEELGIKRVVRYCDDIVILDDSKERLHKWRKLIQSYLLDKLKLELSNYQVFPIANGIDFLGYVSYETHIRIRKSLKKRFVRMIKRNKNQKSIASYYGWLLHGDCKNLWNKYIK